MRSGKSIAALALLALLTACGRHKTSAAPPQAAQAPSLPPAQMAELISPVPPPLPITTERPIKLDTNVPPDVKTTTVASAPKRSVRHHPKAAQQENAQQETPKAPVASPPAPPPANEPPAPEVASGQPSEMSPIGQLSTTNGDANTADRHAISDQIDGTENTLNGIKRSLTSDEQKTVTQIRTFITRARDALKVDDLDGARTLSTKAKLLLEELTKQ
jgi:hypothetical protein